MIFFFFLWGDQPCFQEAEIAAKRALKHAQKQKQEEAAAVAVCQATLMALYFKRGKIQEIRPLLMPVRIGSQHRDSPHFR